MTLLSRIHRYPPQEPLSAAGQSYQEHIMALGEGVSGTEVSYGDSPNQVLTVFPAPRPSGDVLVFFHGGGWTSGYMEWMYFMAPAMQARGVTFVSASYRLAPEHVFPAGLDDAADAIAWVAANIDRYGASASRIFVGGHSAGGHYAALLAVTAKWRAQRGLASDILRGCLPVSGVYLFGPESGLSKRPRFLGGDERHQTDAEASPLLQIAPEVCPPFLLAYGEHDFPHLITQATRMFDALEAQRISVRLHVLKGCDHFDANVACAEQDGGWASIAAEWMQPLSQKIKT